MQGSLVATQQAIAALLSSSQLKETLALIFLRTPLDRLHSVLRCTLEHTVETHTTLPALVAAEAVVRPAPFAHVVAALGRNLALDADAQALDALLGSLLALLPTATGGSAAGVHVKPDELYR